MSFAQQAPSLPHPLHADATLRALIARCIPPPRRPALESDLEALAEHALGAFAGRREPLPREPILTQWDAWGRRIDRVTLTPAWQLGASITTRFGLLAHGHDADAGPSARLEQFLRVYLYHVASEFHTCPLAMSDGAATAIKASGNSEIAARALPRLLSRDPQTLWLSGQWMTETSGGSDVGGTETVARNDNGQWRLYGRKWFTSAIVGEMALALARPEGSDKLGLFYVETRDADGNWNGLRIDRLKDKLGTRELPTAEIHLEGVPAWPLGETGQGIRQIAPMLNVTRTWNAVCAVASMARCIALAGDYATRRTAFGKPLIEQPLHARTLADMQARFEGGFALAMFVAELLGRVEHGSADADQTALLRLLTPLAKLWTGKLATAIASETLECFGGAGYIENTGIPQLLRDAQVYSIWEGTTNVLSLDFLRALGDSGLQPLATGVDSQLANCADETLGAEVCRALERLQKGFAERARDRVALESSARELALLAAQTMAAALLLRQGSWSAEHGDPGRMLAARRFLQLGLGAVHELPERDDLAALARGK